jgi:hypothetical protein
LTPIKKRERERERERKRKTGQKGEGGEKGEKKIKVPKGFARGRVLENSHGARARESIKVARLPRTVVEEEEEEDNEEDSARVYIVAADAN